MKKVILTMLLFLGSIHLAQSQIQVGIKAGINYNSDSFQEIKTDVLDGAKSKTGYHAGIWLRGKVPFLGLYIRPELVFTSLKSNIKAKSTGNIADYNFQKIDIPVLLGKKFFNVAHVFIGPSFQYIIDSEFKPKDGTKFTSKSNGFSMGVQMGIGFEISKFGLDLRWERAFSDTESKLISNDPDFNFDTRVNQIILGLSYRL